jgi:Cu/Ag efflux protein CusF
MDKFWRFAVCAMLTMGICVAQDLVNIILGTIERVDRTTKTIVVKTADGTEHTIRVTDAATVKGTKDGFNGLREGSQIVARTTGAGAEETAGDVGKISEDGFKATEGTVEKFDKDTKKIVVKNVHGAKKTFELGGKALEDAGKATRAGITKGAIVTVYYTEEDEEKLAYYVSN